MDLNPGTTNAALAAGYDKLGLDVPDLQLAYETSQVMAIAESSGMARYHDQPRTNEIWKVTSGLLLEAIRVELLPIAQRCPNSRS